MNAGVSLSTHGVLLVLRLFVLSTESAKDLIRFLMRQKAMPLQIQKELKKSYGRLCTTSVARFLDGYYDKMIKKIDTKIQEENLALHPSHRITMNMSDHPGTAGLSNMIIPQQGVLCLECRTTLRHRF